MQMFKIDTDRLRHVITILRDHGEDKSAAEIKRLLYYYLYTYNLAPLTDEQFEAWIKGEQHELV